jgi:uncharacterized membrane protein HdeD (DUF308 family)
MFKPNESTTDRVIRFIVGIVLLVAGYLWLGSPWNWIAYVLGAIGVITSLTGSCLIYQLFGWSTKQSAS